MTPRKLKPKPRKGEQVWWTIAYKGTPIPKYARPTRFGVGAAFLAKNGIDIENSINHKPVRIIVRLA